MVATIPHRRRRLESRLDKLEARWSAIETTLDETAADHAALRTRLENHLRALKELDVRLTRLEGRA